MSKKTAKEVREDLVRSVAEDAKELEAIAEREAITKKRLRKHTVEFVDFIREKGIVGLAIGIIIGTNVTALVQSLVGDIVNPLLGLVLPKAERLTDSTFQFFSAQIRWGAFAVTLLNFLVVTLVIFICFKLFKLDRLDKKNTKD